MIRRARRAPMSTFNVNNMFSSFNSYSSYSNTNYYRNFKQNYMNDLIGSLGEYSSIKSGSYRKLLKSHFANEEGSILNKVGNSKLNSVKTEAGDLKSSLTTLTSTGKDSVFTKQMITTKDDSGNEVKKLDYDYEAIATSIEKFVKEYNDLVKTSGDQDTNSILRKASIMTFETKAFKNSLEQIGITVGADNILSLNKEKLQDADMDQVKLLFEGVNSFGGKLSKKASEIHNLAAIEIAKNSKASYNKTGSYNYLNGAFYEGLL